MLAPTLTEDTIQIPGGPQIPGLTFRPYQGEADMNEDDVVNGLDVDPFVAAVVGGGAAAVPEPSSTSAPWPASARWSPRGSR